jgi:hypothetical protein
MPSCRRKALILVTDIPIVRWRAEWERTQRILPCGRYDSPATGHDRDDKSSPDSLDVHPQARINASVNLTLLTTRGLGSAS